MANTTASAGALIFQFPAYQLRTVMRDGEPWFVAADVIAALGIGNITDALRRLDDEEKGFDSIDTLGGVQQLAIVNESGLYSLILGSRKPEAKKFKKWVTAEVLPAIRRTGRYVATQVGPEPQAMRALPVTSDDLVRQVASLSRQVANLSRRVITTQGKLVKVQARNIELIEGRMSGEEASATIIAMVQQGEPRERIRLMTGRSYNAIRQAIFKARQRGDLAAAEGLAGQQPTQQQGALDLEGSRHA
jgi:prophage antirepressor-like protein